MSRTAKGLAILVALLVARPLAAQTTPPPSQAPAPPASGNDIVVTGKAPPRSDEVFQEARGISRIGPYETYVVALPRFWSPVCPGVFGLRGDYAAAMVERMRTTIAGLKVRVAREGCSPNLVVAFEDDGRTLLSDLQRDRPGIFELVSQSEKAELLADPAPVHVWNNIAMRWTGAGAPPARGLKASVWGQLNRNAMPESYDIVSALVIFDRSAVKGMTVTQLADYATMRGLSHTRPAPSGQPLATILSLFDNQGAGQGAGPDALTDFDTGYLRSLYFSEPNASAAHKLYDVERWTAKARAEAAADPGR